MLNMSHLMLFLLLVVPPIPSPTSPLSPGDYGSSSRNHRLSALGVSAPSQRAPCPCYSRRNSDPAACGLCPSRRYPGHPVSRGEIDILKGSRTHTPQHVRHTSSKSLVCGAGYILGGCVGSGSTRWWAGREVSTLRMGGKHPGVRGSVSLQGLFQKGRSHRK